MRRRAVKPAPTGRRRRLDVACVRSVIASGGRMQPSAVKPAPTRCRRRLDVACVGLIIATGHQMQPSAVEPAPTSCRRRLDVACVGLVIASGHRVQPSAVKPAPTRCRRRLDVACVGLVIERNPARSSPRLQVVGDGLTSLAWGWSSPPVIKCSQARSSPRLRVVGEGLTSLSWRVLRASTRPTAAAWNMPSPMAPWKSSMVSILLPKTRVFTCPSSCGAVAKTAARIRGRRKADAGRDRRGGCRSAPSVHRTPMPDGRR